MQSNYNPPVNVEVIKSEIRAALINNKAFAGPIAMRAAWHAAGTYDKNDGSGGSNGATMRFDPERTDPANAGLSIIRDLLLPVKKKHPDVSEADLWTYAGVLAIEFMGGPKVPYSFGRTDHPDATKCPANGRLPDAAQGAEHLRAVFYRMGFNDQEIVALSGAHTVGRCHLSRSGYDGPWSFNPLRFDNSYFRLLMDKDWKPITNAAGKEQFTDETGRLMMLPTDMCLKTDPVFSKYAQAYADSQDLFFKDFAQAYGKLLALGCPFSQSALSLTPSINSSSPLSANPSIPTDQTKERYSAEFREAAMHGSILVVKELSKKADINELENYSHRTALHKAAFWGHTETVKYLTEIGVDVNVQDKDGDTALHDACRFGHFASAQILLEVPNININLRNKNGLDALALAIEHGHKEIADLLKNKHIKQAKL